MRNLLFSPLVFICCLLSCTQQKKQESPEKTGTVATAVTSSPKTTSADKTSDKQQIQTLISKIVNGGEWKRKLNLTPVLFNPKDSLYYGFDLQILKTNLEILKSSNLFSAGFIENYNQIILTLDKKLRNGQYQKFGMGELPSFPFANDVDPWCECQDVPYDEPNAFDFIETEVIKLNHNNGQLNWVWGNLPPGTDKSWKEFKYRFDVIKEDNVWKISYLQGFDYKQSTL